MIRICLFITFICLQFSAISQKKVKDSLQFCSSEMKATSFFWKKDSLANNGYRLSNVDNFLKCKLDTISLKYMINSLGSPNRIQKTNQGVEYIYYTYDYRNFPKETRPWEVIYYVSFRFKDENGFIEYISKGHFTPLLVFCNGLVLRPHQQPNEGKVLS